jgi:leader peptidase (prepilin peptidase)/N-methyltransferase
MDTSTWLTAIAAALVGLVAGSWVTVMIAWLPRTEPGLRWPPTRCPRCGARLGLADLVPFTGWRRLQAHCCTDQDEAAQDRADQDKAGRDRADHGGVDQDEAGQDGAVGGWHPAAGLVTAAVFVIMAVRFGASPVLPAFCFLGVIGVALAFIDAGHRRLPDALTLLAYPVALVLLGVAALTVPDGGRHFLVALIGLAAAWLLFLIQGLIYPAGIGWGDIKLSGVLGLYLGWLGVGALVAGLFLGYLLAALAGLGLLAARRATRKSLLPFGPFLLAGTLIAIVLSYPGGPLH